MGKPPTNIKPMQIPDVGNAAAVFVLERVRTFVLCTVLWQVVDAGRFCGTGGCVYRVLLSGMYRVELRKDRDPIYQAYYISSWEARSMRTECVRRVVGAIELNAVSSTFNCSIACIDQN